MEVTWLRIITYSSITNNRIPVWRLGSSASRKRRQKWNPVPRGKLGHPVPGGYKYGDLAFQVGGVSDETVKYGREFCGTSSQE
jgi:hypothetical protein